MKSNITYGINGAIAYQSTNNYLLDLFTYSSTKFPDNLEEFIKLVNIIYNAMSQDPITFLKLIKFHRLIKKGNAIKIIYYLSMVLLKYTSIKDYEHVLKWSYQYPKDLLVLQRLTNMLKPIANDLNFVSSIPIEIITKKKNKGTRANKLQAYANCNINSNLNSIKNINHIEIQVQTEIIIYADLILLMFKDMFQNIFQGNNVNPMLVKYLSYNDGHWTTETKLIWDVIETKIKNSKKNLNNTSNNNFCNYNYFSIINSNINLNSKLASNLRDLIKPRLNESIIFTNKIRRQIKKLFNENINLLDNLYKGIHSDNTLFYTHGDENKEVKMISNSIKKTPTISFNKFEKTVKNYNLNNANNTQKLLHKGYMHFLSELTTGNAKIKTQGSAITDIVWEFFDSNLQYDLSTEAKLIEISNELRIYLQDTVSNQMSLEDIGSRIVLLLDISGSMQGSPIKTGLLYITLMAKVFKIKTLYYFESEFKKVFLTDEDINGSMCSLVKKIYLYTSGSTCLESAFKAFEQDKIINKYIMIITDGDCNPGFNSSNPFKTATVKSPKNIYLYQNSFIIVNVKETKLNFPYLNIDPQVCYITGNNPKTINGFIKAMIVSIQENKQITPDMVLRYSINLEELNIDKNLLELNYNKKLNNSDLENLYSIFIKNLPKKNSIDIINKTEFLENNNTLLANTDNSWNNNINFSDSWV